MPQLRRLSKKHASLLKRLKKHARQLSLQSRKLRLLLLRLKKKLVLLLLRLRRLLSSVQLSQQSQLLIRLPNPKLLLQDPLQMLQINPD